jgi:hypothetical protein
VLTIREHLQSTEAHLIVMSSGGKVCPSPVASAHQQSAEENLIEMVWRTLAL